MKFYILILEFQISLLQKPLVWKYLHFQISKKRHLIIWKCKENVQKLAFKTFNTIFFLKKHKIFAKKEGILYKHGGARVWFSFVLVVPLGVFLWNPIRLFLLYFMVCFVWFNYFGVVYFWFGYVRFGYVSFGYVRDGSVLFADCFVWFISVWFVGLILFS